MQQCTIAAVKRSGSLRGRVARDSSFQQVILLLQVRAMRYLSLDLSFTTFDASFITFIRSEYHGMLSLLEPRVGVERRLA